MYPLSQMRRENKSHDADATIYEITEQDIKEIALLAAEFRIFLKLLKSIKAQEDIPAGERELQQYLASGCPVYAVWL